MSKIIDILPEPVAGQEAFIFDHGKIEDGTLKYQDDVTSYGWNVRQFNKVHPGAYVLNRHPGKITADRKFEIYGGGYVESISEPDEDGNVVAVISHPFTIVPPLKQGDTFLENYEWDSKNKKPGTWGHFWNQYGMNTISLTDYENLIEAAHCVPCDAGNIVTAGLEEDISEGEVVELSEDVDSSGFTVTVEENGPVHQRRDKKYSGVAKKPDYDKIQKARNKTGALGEEIIMDVLTQRASASGDKPPVHVSKEEGDGLGYDIRYWENGQECHAEVKTSKDSYSDGFEMTYNELAASLDPNYKYVIFRVYGLNIKTKTCRLKEYVGPITDETFKLVTTKVAVYQK